MKIGVIGLGSMGFGMAASLLRAGHVVHGGDVNPDAVKRLQAEGAARDKMCRRWRLNSMRWLWWCSTRRRPRRCCSARAALWRSFPRKAVVILCVTVAPDYARGVGKRCAERGIEFLDAPISGGSVKAAQGKLSVMASGTAQALARARPALDAMAETVFELGDAPGAGSAMKAVNQMLAGVHIAAMAEAMTFGMTQGVAPEAFMKVIPRCAGTSWMLENRGPACGRRVTTRRIPPWTSGPRTLALCWMQHAPRNLQPPSRRRQCSSFSRHRAWDWGARMTPRWPKSTPAMRG